MNQNFLSVKDPQLSFLNRIPLQTRTQPQPVAPLLQPLKANANFLTTLPSLAHLNRFQPISHVDPSSIPINRLPIPNTYPTITPVAKKKPNQRVIFDVVNHLKKLEGKAVTADELSKHLGIEKKDLVEILQGNPKILIVESGRESKFSYKPTHDVRNNEEILDLIINTPDGIDQNDLIDAYRNVENDIKALADAKKIIKVKNSDQNTEILYPNETHLMIDLYPDFRELWKKVKVPAESDLQEEMYKIGLKKTIEKDKVHQLKRPVKEKKKT